MDIQQIAAPSYGRVAEDLRREAGYAQRRFEQLDIELEELRAQVARTEELQNDLARKILDMRAAAALLENNAEDNR